MSTSTPNSTDIIKLLGNSWVVCRSKSYAGRIYYFNTETGEAAWNLSDSDIEKAKKSTIIYEKQMNLKSVNYPEPSESPQDISSISNLQHLRNNNPHVNNKQVIQFSSPSLNALQLNMPVSTLYNPMVWNIPSQPVLLTPTSHTQLPVIHDVNYDSVPISNTTVTLSNRFKSYSDVYNTNLSTCFNTFHKKPNNNLRFHKLSMTPSKTNSFTEISNLNVDLRFLLSAKRRNYKDEREESSVPGFNNTSYENQTILDEYKNNEHTERDEALVKLYNSDDYWLEENMLSNGLSNTIDTRTIRNVVGADENEDHLYIVTDETVLMNDINFLNMLLFSDMLCHLVVPRVVMNQVLCATSTGLRAQAQKVVYLLSKHIMAGFAVIDEITGENIDYKNEIINCCLRLVDNKCYMILLTNDENILQLPNKMNFPILSISETKRLACNISDPKKNSYDTLNKDSNIQITVDNDRNKSIIKNSEEPKEDSINDNALNIVTDHDNVGSVDTSNKITSNELPNTSELVSQKEDDHESTNLLSENTCSKKSLPITRKIQLKRSISSNTSCTSLPMSNNRKQYKWHRKRTKSHLSNVSDDQVTSVPSLQSEDAQQNCLPDFNTPCNAPGVENESPNLTGNHSIPCYISSSNESSHSDHKNIEIQQKVDLEKSIKSGISNTVTYSNSEDKCNVENNVHNTSADQTIDNNVMFEVTNQVMEDCLKMKCDEWVSRFTQIMEEVLTQLLRRGPTFVYDNMPPPWTVYEATECIKRIFHEDCDVVDAANKFCNVLFELGGLRGKIRNNISPQKYMEMYSYGVYLIDSLQGILNSCEDLQTASESLAKLLSDIQETNSEQSNNDSFGELHETSFAETVCSVTDETKNNSNTDSVASLGASYKIQKPQFNYDIISPRKYTLRSQSKRKSQLPDTPPDLESTFFTCLHLRKNPISELSNLVKEKEAFVEPDGSMPEESVKLRGKKSDIDETNQAQLNTEPKIVRNFVTCLDIEEKLKSKYNGTNNNETDCYEDKELDNKEIDAEYYECEYQTMMERSSTSKENILNESLGGINDSMKCIIQEVLNEAREAFSSIYTFCKKAREQIDSSDKSKLKKDELNKDAEKTHLYVIQICSLLERILKRESSNSEYKINKIMDSPEFNSYKINEEELIDYRRVIKKYLKQGNLLKESVRLLIDASRE